MFMMLPVTGASKTSCGLLAVFCGTSPNSGRHEVSENGAKYPIPELVSSGRLEVQTLVNPKVDEFKQVVKTTEPGIVYLQGKQHSDNKEIGSLVWGNLDLSSVESICELFDSTLPTTVYLEIPDGEKLAEALYSKGVRYVIYWKSGFSCYAACHFREALLSVVQSSCSHTWDAFQLAHASFRLYCGRNNQVLPANNQNISGKLGPRLLGDPPKVTVPPMENGAGEGEEEDEEREGEDSLPAIKIYDDEVNVRFLVCGLPCTLDACLLGSLEDGLNALLNIEMRGSKLHNRVSAPPPPLQAAAFSRGVVTMRCDVSTCSSAHISLLVSGSAQTCFDDQLLETHIKNEVIEKSQLVHAPPDSEENKPSLSEPRRSAAVACGAAVFEVCMKVPAWASQVLRQLAPQVTYRSFVSLGIASIQGSSVASFENDDADRLLFFCAKQGKESHFENAIPKCLPKWLKPPAPSRKRSEPCQELKVEEAENKEARSIDACRPIVPLRKKVKISAMRPIPHTRRHKMQPFVGIPEVGDTFHMPPPKSSFPPISSAKHNGGGHAPTHRKTASTSLHQAHQIISLNPIPLKKHGCGRSPITVCSEEEFLRDVMQFLMLRGHSRLVPQGGVAEFPEAILNAKRLDLFSLYREVVSRGGFHVGNGINWKGQVFSKMRNHTVTNRMTGVGNTLKRHYETYLLEYELAHDDVDGECCLLCHSSAAGDWVNCGMCGEWAHFGCDRRQGLGAFKDYAKTDGLEYICPHCSINYNRRKPPKVSNGFSQGSAAAVGGASYSLHM